MKRGLEKQEETRGLWGLSSEGKTQQESQEQALQNVHFIKMHGGQSMGEDMEAKE